MLICKIKYKKMSVFIILIAFRISLRQAGTVS